MDFGGRSGPDGPRGMGGGSDNYGGNRGGGSGGGGGGGWGGEYEDDLPPPMNPRMMPRGGPSPRSGGGAMRNTSSSFGGNGLVSETQICYKKNVPSPKVNKKNFTLQWRNGSWWSKP